MFRVISWEKIIFDPASRASTFRGLTLFAVVLSTLTLSSSSRVNAHQARYAAKNPYRVSSAHWNLHIMKIRCMSARRDCGAAARISAFRNKCPRWSNLNVILYKFTSCARLARVVCSRATSRSTDSKPIAYSRKFIGRIGTIANIYKCDRINPPACFQCTAIQICINYLNKETGAQTLRGLASWWQRLSQNI